MFGAFERHKYLPRRLRSKALEETRLSRNVKTTLTVKLRSCVSSRCEYFDHNSSHTRLNGVELNDQPCSINKSAPNIRSNVDKQPHPILNGREREMHDNELVTTQNTNSIALNGQFSFSHSICLMCFA